MTVLTRNLAFSENYAVFCE